MNKRIILLVIVFFISIIILSVNTNNKYLVKEESLATYIDGEKADSFPAKGTVAFSKADCDNNINIEWDNDNWGLYVTNLSNKVKCNIYFKTGENAVTKITSLVSSDTTNMASDDPDNNIRYIGANPNNYVYFNCSDYDNQTSDTCEKWRIIGVFNNIEKEDGTKEKLIKIIRNEFIGNYSWDSSEQSINGGYGVNDWTSSDIMKLLNPEYSNFKVNGSLYYNGYKGTCYIDFINTTEACDFTTTGLKNNRTRNGIETVLWKIGGVSNFDTSDNGLVSHWYSYERGTNTYSGRSTSWVGKIGLMYPSDYGYATSGGTSADRNTCLQKELYKWDTLEDCYNNDYIFNGAYQWTMIHYAGNAIHVIGIRNTGYVRDVSGASYNDTIRPTLFLKSNTLITSGDGSSNTPYQLGL